MDAMNDYQQQHVGLHVQPLPPRRPGRAWKVIRWLLVMALVAVCAVSVVFNLIGSAGFAGAGSRQSRIEETHVSGPTSFSATAKVAVVTIDDIISGTEDSGPASWMLRQLDRALDDDKVKAVLLDVNSPGGGITASDVIHRKILDLKDEGKSVIVLMRDVAASGAYYISAPADLIIAHPTTITGSIGVIVSTFNIEGLFDKIGVQSVVFKSAPHKDLLSPYRAVTPEESAIVQDITGQMFEIFKQKVAEGRNLSAEEVDAVSSGAIFTASQALDLKLIDQVGYYDDAVKAAVKAAGAVSVEVVKYDKTPTLADVLLGSRAETPDLNAELASFVESRKPGFYYLWVGP